MTPSPKAEDLSDLTAIILPATYASGTKAERQEFAREIAGRIIAAGWRSSRALQEQPK